MKTNKLFLWILLLFGIGCQPKRIEYTISDQHSGPCVVFVYDSLKGELSNVVEVENGLGRILESQLNQKFIFRSSERHKEIEIIPISDTIIAKGNERYIYRLTNELASNTCIAEDLHTISFFAGTKESFESWSSAYESELIYFDSIGVDWCKFYLAPLVNKK